MKIDVALFTLYPGRGVVSAEDRIISIRALFNSGLLNDLNLSVDRFSLLIRDVGYGILRLVERDINGLRIRVMSRLRLRVDLRRFLASLMTVIPVVAKYRRRTRCNTTERRRRPSLLFSVVCGLLRLCYL